MNKRERHLAAIMFTDIVGYSAMMQKDEEYALKIRNRHREVFERYHKQHGGKIMQYYGDGTLSIFSSTTDAVECAVAIQQSLKHHPRVPLRIGVHIGDISYSDEEVFGDGVNIAARIESKCVPGGVFISGKAYDDIKNHPRLKAKKLGAFALKNIHQDIDIYGISNSGITFPEYSINPAFTQAPSPKLPRTAPTRKVGRRKRWVAVLLALFFGVFGSHRFYLQQRRFGIIYLSLFFAGTFIFQGWGQLTAIPAILGLIDAIAFMSMSRDNFDAKFNPEYLAQKVAEEEQRQAALKRANDPKTISIKQFKAYFKQAEQQYREFDFDGAIDQLLKAIEIKYDVPEAHFLLARCYSINEDADRAMHHIEAAMAFNLKKPERIKTHDDLAFLRVQEKFGVFEANNYRLPSIETPSDQELPELDLSNDLLDQLSKLQQEWESGNLTDQEFQSRKNNLMSDD